MLLLVVCFLKHPGKHHAFTGTAGGVKMMFSSKASSLIPKGVSVFRAEALKLSFELNGCDFGGGFN